MTDVWGIMSAIEATRRAEGLLRGGHERGNTKKGHNNACGGRASPAGDADMVPSDEVVWCCLPSCPLKRAGLAASHAALGILVYRVLNDA